MFFMGKLCKNLFPEHSFNLNYLWYLCYMPRSSLIHFACIRVAPPPLVTGHKVNRDYYYTCTSEASLNPKKWYSLDLSGISSLAA